MHHLTQFRRQSGHYRYLPAEIIAHAVWLYYRFALSLRDVEDPLAERGIDVSFQTVSEWDCFAISAAAVARDGRYRWVCSEPGARGFQSSVRQQDDRSSALQVTHDRSIGLPTPEGKVINANYGRELIVLFGAASTKGRVPKRIVTDKLRSYGAARRQIMPTVEHRSHKGLNNRAENSHLPLRKRERLVQWFRSPGALQRFTSVFSAVRNLFVPPRSKRSAIPVHLHRLRAIAHWKAVTGTTA